MKEKICHNCTYYLAHHIKTQTAYKEVNAGHCIWYLDCKNVCPYKKACEHFSKRDMEKEKIAQERTIAQKLDSVSKTLTSLKEVLTGKIED
jgi:hypothetical protein